MSSVSVSGLWSTRTYGAMFADAARLVSLVPMNASTSLVLWHLMDELDSVEWRYSTQREMAGKLAVDRSSVQRGLRDLIDRSIIERRDDGGMRLSPFLIWKGSPLSYRVEGRLRAEAVEAAFDWHVSRAIANIDGDALKMTFREDMAEIAARGIEVTDRPEPDPNIDAALTPQVACPAGVNETDFTAMTHRVVDPQPDSGLWEEVVEAVAHHRDPEMDIHDLLDDVFMAYFETPEHVRERIDAGIIRRRPV